MPDAFHQYASHRDADAFRHLVHQYQRLVYSAARRRLARSHDIEDAVQITFLKLAKAAATLRADGTTLATWLYATALNTANELIRNDQTRLRHEAALIADTENRIGGRRETPSPSLELEQQEFQKLSLLIDDALLQLPADQQSLLIEHFFNNRSTRELAKILRTSQSTTTRRIAAAVDALRHKLHTLGHATSIPALAVALPQLTAGTVPATLAASLTKIGLAGTSGPATLAIPALSWKTAFIATLKAHTLAAASIAALIITVPAVLIAANLPGTPPVAPPPAAATRPPANPIEAIPDPYALVEGEFLKHIPSASAEVRDLLWKQLDIGTRAAAQPSPTPASISLFLNNNQRDAWTWSQDRPATLSAVLEYFLDMPPQLVEGEPAHTEFPIPGDFVARRDATPEQLRADLEKILRAQQQPLALAFRVVPRKVIVLDGDWKFTPADSPRAARGTVPFLEIYQTSIARSPQSLSVGDARRFANRLGKSFNREIVIDAKNFPARLTWASNDSNRERFDDPAPVLNNLKPQTGLTWTEQTRDVRRLFIEPAAK